MINFVYPSLAPPGLQQPRFHKFDRPKLLSVVQQSLEKQRLRGGENATILIGDVINGVSVTARAYLCEA